MKKKVLFFAAAVVCAVIGASGTMAYFTAEDKAHNVITTSAVDVKIEEWQETEDGWVSYPKEPVEVMPGTSVSKIATIKNDGSDAYVRAKFDVSLYDAQGKMLEVSSDLLQTIISVAMNSEAWQQKESDKEWWYYTEIVESGEFTEAFFTEVVFDGKNMTNEYQNCTIEVNVTAQAVQAANNGEDALTASGWPA